VKGKSGSSKIFNLKAPCIGNKIHLFCKKAGIEGIHTHSLRHRYAQDLIESGADIKIIQDLLGHENLNTTQVYLATTDKRKRDAVSKLEKKEITTESLKGTIIPVDKNNLQEQDTTTSGDMESFKEMFQEFMEGVNKKLEIEPENPANNKTYVLIYEKEDEKQKADRERAEKRKLDHNQVTLLYEDERTVKKLKKCK
jgi:hypothetical protein